MVIEVLENAQHTKSSVRILILEDNPGDAYLLDHMLKEIPSAQVETRTARSVAEADSLLAADDFSLIFSDLDVPDSSGLETVARMLDNPRNLPVVVLSGAEARGTALDAIRMGAQDFLEKGQITALALDRAVTHSLERHSINRELKSSVKALETANRRFVQMVSDLTDAVVVVGADGTIMFVNPAAERMFDKHASALVGDVFDVRLDGSAPVELDIRAADGAICTVEVRAVETAWDGQPAWIASLRDITERKRAEHAMRIAQQAAETANEMKSRFLANMSHELRTPLNSIIGFSDLIQTEQFGSVGNARYREYAGDISHSGHLLLSLINDLLDLSKAEADRYELVETEFDLLDTLHAAVRMVTPQAQDKSQFLFVRALVDDCRVFAGERQITQVLVNLLSNAIKFTPEQGRIEMNVCEKADGAVAISVADNGIGIDPDQIPNLFTAYSRVGEPYLKEREQGTGLGLALSKRLVEMHGGHIDLESAPGEGTTAIVTLPHERVRSLQRRALRAVAG